MPHCTVQTSRPNLFLWPCCLHKRSVIFVQEHMQTKHCVFCCEMIWIVDLLISLSGLCPLQYMHIDTQRPKSDNHSRLLMTVLWITTLPLFPSAQFACSCLWTRRNSGVSMVNVRLPRPVVIEHRGSSFISVSQRQEDWSGEGQWGGGHCWVLRALELSLKVYLLKGSPTACPSLVDSVNVLTLLTNLEHLVLFTL